MKLNIEEKLETAVNTLFSWSTVKYIFPLDVKFAKSNKENYKLPIDNYNLEFIDFKEPWTLFKQDEYYWFKVSFDIKKENKYQKAFLCIETFIHNVASTIRPQGLLYLNNELVQGIDINHTDVLLEDGHYDMLLHYHTHVFSFSLPLYFSIKYRDSRILDLYYDLETILDSWKNLLKLDNNYLIQQETIDNALNLIDFRNKYDDYFYSSIKKCKKYLQDEYFNKICGKSNYTIAAIGHSHIDMAWLWDLATTRIKAQRTFSTVLKLMEEYKEYKYMHTSPQLFKYLKEDNPLLFNKIKDKVNEGRFELEGAMWVEADNNLISGESLVRQILYGQEFFKKEFNITCRTVIEPDVFGYSAQLPQILKKSNIDRFVTAKIGWNDTNRYPFDSFNWKGIDGSEVFTYLISTCDSDVRSGIFDRTYTDYVGKMNASQIVGCVNRYQQKDLNKTLIMTYGYGDGGGGVTREMLEKQRRFKYGLPGLAKTKIMGLNESLDIIEANFKSNCFLLGKNPTWEGELYFEYHRGTYTSVPRNKKNNRYAEISLNNVETLSCLNKFLNFNEYPYEEIRNNYELLLLNQFHDIIPGSGIEDIYLDSDKDYKKIFESNEKIIDDCLNNLAQNVMSQKGLLVFNPNAFICNDYILNNGKCYEILNVPSLGYEVINLRDSISLVNVSDYKLANPFFEITFNSKGEITSLFDKKLNKEFVKKGETINKFICYEDMPYQYDNWELAPYYFEKKYEIDSKATFEVLLEGDRKGFKITRKYFNSVIVQRIYLYNSLPRVDIFNEVIWKEKRQVLKIHFPLNMDVKKTNYDIQFGNVQRNAKIESSYDEAKFEVYGQKWVDISDGKVGFALLNDSKYGFGFKNNDLSLTVLKSGSFPYEGASDIVPPFVFSIYTHEGDYKNGVIEQAYLVNKKLLYKDIRPHLNQTIDDFSSFIKIKNEGVYLETLKLSEDKSAYILRLYEGHGEEKIVSIKLPSLIKKAFLTDLMENKLKEISIDENHCVSFKINKFEIITLRCE